MFNLGIKRKLGLQLMLFLLPRPPSFNVATVWRHTEHICISPLHGSGGSIFLQALNVSRHFAMIVDDVWLFICLFQFLLCFFQRDTLLATNPSPGLNSNSKPIHQQVKRSFSAKIQLRDQMAATKTSQTDFDIRFSFDTLTTFSTHSKE